MSHTSILFKDKNQMKFTLNIFSNLGVYSSVLNFHPSGLNWLSTQIMHNLGPSYVGMNLISPCNESMSEISFYLHCFFFLNLNSALNSKFTSWEVAGITGLLPLMSSALLVPPLRRVSWLPLFHLQLPGLTGDAITAGHWSSLRQVPRASEPA